jgi:hypothetical protein
MALLGDHPHIRSTATVSAKTPMPAPSAAATVVIRAASCADRPALANLATVARRPLPGGELIVAEVDGALAAALSLFSGERVVDPCRGSADVLALLSLRAARLRSPAPRGRRHRLRVAAGARAA